MGGKGGGGDVEYSQSPEQRQIFQEVLPIVKMMSGAAQEGRSPWGQMRGAPIPQPYPLMSDWGRGAYGGAIGTPGGSSVFRGPIYPSPSQAGGHIFKGVGGSAIGSGVGNILQETGTGMGTQRIEGVAPGRGVFSGVQSYGIPGYNVGSYETPGAVTPSQGWFSGMSNEVKQGLWEPWKEGANQMLEVMGARGQGGSPGAGYSGAAGRAMGEMMSDAGKQVGLQAWQMQQPGLMAEYQAQLGRGRDVWGAGLDKNKWLAQQELLRNMTERGELQRERLADYQQNLGYLQGIDKAEWANWQNEMMGKQFPFQMLPGMAGGTYSQGYIPDGGLNLGGALGGGAMGGMMGIMGGAATQPYLWPLVGLGALGGLFS